MERAGIIRKTVFYILMILVSLLICFVIIFLGKYGRQYYIVRKNKKLTVLVPNMYRKSEILPYLLKPNTVTREDISLIKINGQGFREDREIAEHKDPASLRVMFLGDSCTFGYRVQNKETYPSIISEKVNKDMVFKRQVETINAARNGYCPDMYYLYFKNIGIRYHPDYLIIGFHPCSDITDTMALDWIDVDKYGLPTKIRGGRYVPREDNRLILTNNLKLREPIGKFSKYFESCKMVRAEELFQYYVRYNFEMPLDQELINQGWERNLLSLKALKELCKTNNIKLVILILPFEGQIVKNKYSKKIYDNTDHQKIVKGFCEDYNILYLDVLDRFRTYCSQNNCKDLFMDYAHWYVEGNVLIADEVIRFLKKDLVKSIN